ncbi:TPA: hypothetical protein ACMDQE_003474 [Vibrio cholerae]|uniref:hypothetical protein n=1 Tax=Vibrio cholerae TaxID=666 RepID=UPI00313EF5FA|nr:hypothetical protein [Vibrio cholerae]
MIKEIISSLSGNVRERASSPILGSYTVTALLVNWKAIVVLFTSELSGGLLVQEILSVSPPLDVAVLYPMLMAVAISLGYPTLRAVISSFNTYSRLLEIKAEYKLEMLKDNLSLRRDPIDNLIRQLYVDDYYDKISYHDLKRLLDALPKEKDLLIRDDNA